MKALFRTLLLVALAASYTTGCGRADNEAAADADAREEGGAHAEGALELSAAERTAQGIVTARAGRRAVSATLTAPGEVRTNAYRSALVTPRITAQIVARHARLGDTVTQGQPLVTLSSVPMAEAQGALIEADREWQRVRELGREVVSEARYVSAQVARQRSYATVAAYGMTEARIDGLLERGDASRAMGGFELLSPQAGTVLRDDFVVGELIEPGRALFEISDESVLWVQAQLSSMDVARVMPGTTARVSRDGARWLEGTVVQLQHRLDETTRTQGVRVEVENRDDELHPGDYVDVVLETAASAPQVAVPSDAVVLMDGASAVFKIEGDDIFPQPVETGVTASGWTEIRAGLAVDDEVVTQGAFLVKSLMLKSQMGEGHAH
jgi:cobalt-zinc-cadmium efflux system membrane fusion protein